MILVLTPDQSWGSGPSATGRYSLICVLSEIPAAAWRRPDWQPLAAEARRNLEALELRIKTGETQAGADTWRFMSVLTQRLG